ncbi:MAG: hypothetical protein RLZZ455_1205 [Candidatus Parcubacteria bacterium]|jgi:SAM-dependent methyltransferase
MVNLILFTIVILLLIALSMIWPPDSPWAPWWRTSGRIARAMCKLARVGKKDVVYDLGSGDGTALIVAADEYGARGVGVEIDPLRAYVSMTRTKLERVAGKVTIHQKNFFDVSIRDATVVFVYLVPKALHRLKPKFASELRPGTRIVSFRYQIPYLPLTEKDELHQIYLYTIPKSFVTS